MKNLAAAIIVAVACLAFIPTCTNHTIKFIDIQEARYAQQN